MLLTRLEAEPALNAVGSAGPEAFGRLPQGELEVPQMLGDLPLLDTRALRKLVSGKLFGSQQVGYALSDSLRSRTLGHQPRVHRSSMHFSRDCGEAPAERRGSAVPQGDSSDGGMTVYWTNWLVVALLGALSGCVAEAGDSTPTSPCTATR